LTTARRFLYFDKQCFTLPTARALSATWLWPCVCVAVCLWVVVRSGHRELISRKVYEQPTVQRSWAFAFVKSLSVANPGATNFHQEQAS
jgi:hypothetical protein